MKKVKLIFIFFLSVQSFLLSNPIDGTPVAKFSELVFDSNNNWTMELLFSDRYNFDTMDSVIIKTSNSAAKLLISYRNGIQIYVITSDSLSVPLVINRDGDSIQIVTYSTENSAQRIRYDYLIFGNHPNTGVGSPTLGYSSICRIFGEFNLNNWSIDCLSKNSSLGIINNIAELSATLKGHIYDMNNEPVTQLKVFPVSPCYFELETPLTINSDGTYTTQIFRRFSTIIRGLLSVKMVDFEAFYDTAAIEPFELNDIHPDTVVVQDIHLESNKYVVTSIEGNEPLRSEEFTLLNYPNPFNLSTNFFINIPDRVKEKATTINIYDANGQLVRMITVNESTMVSWDGRDKNSSIMPSGIYYYQLNIEKQMMKSGSMILLK
ncbi:MAG: T9SS type A sorting domain-containing protein [Ignavibacteriaceae bacterium]|nr:T9SS type A sorting domain-containing protein [Ignavibacteriaceae bacterium]